MFSGNNKFALLVLSMGVIAFCCISTAESRSKRIKSYTSRIKTRKSSKTTARGQDVYDIGVGIADITGPAADINMMGYGKPEQETAGIHTRLFSRAFIVGDGSGPRVVYVNTDIGMVSQAIKIEVAKRLKLKYNGFYNEGNVLLGATHTHSGPGGFLQYVLYIITAQGFIRQSFEAIVSGIILSIERAHQNVMKGNILFNEGELLDTNVNRSPTAYDNNPADEKARYSYDTDKGMQILKFVDISGQPMGLISWFPVHCTSMNNTNRLISGDNKGYASYLFEKQMNPGFFPGKGAFVAAFANANEGDVSPNIQGPRCMDTGLPCDSATSTCGGANEQCVASGPGGNIFESTRLIGLRQYEKARQLFESAEQKVTGPVSFIHQHIDMSSVAIIMPNNSTVHTCKSSMGYSFAAGTTDGPGAFDFQQGETKSTPFWNLVRDFLRRPSADLLTCQYPKPILVATGEMKFPYLWQPSILPTQILKIGNIAIAALPGEFTTMAGRRIREQLKQEFDQYDNGQSQVLLTGLANAYSSYITTFEEYQVQRYEGASTIFGPHTLEAYIHQYKMLASHLSNKQPIVPGPDPPDLIDRQISLKPGVVFDGAPFGHHFGDLVHDAHPSYEKGVDQVYVSFIAGHPRNDLQSGKSFLSVERRDNSTGQWLIVATDASWETKFYWTRTNTLFAESQAIIIWDIPEDADPGTYRIRHFGASKSLLQRIKPYVGVTKSFQVI